MRKIGAHAVVVDASMGGLLAARVLADAHQKVTVTGRDSLPLGLAQAAAVIAGQRLGTEGTWNACGVCRWVSTWSGRRGRPIRMGWLRRCCCRWTRSGPVTGAGPVPGCWR